MDSAGGFDRGNKKYAMNFGKNITWRVYIWKTDREARG
jgi:hypothetical protein